LFRLPAPPRASGGLPRRSTSRTGSPNRDFDLHAVSYPYARPEVALFIERLASQYRSACGEKLVVTSLTRPQNSQPVNASSRSVHPTGIAIDLRRSGSARCRGWLEDVLVSLERTRVLEATRENNPPHYHVALFPREYAGYVERITERPVELPATVGQLDARKYEVRPGDSLWTIARKLGTTVDRLKNENELDSSRIYAGQVIQVPAGR
jgi:LysM repeat protein